MDTRVEKAQQLFWEVSLLESHGAARAALPKLVEMATLHQERATELLTRRDPDGWTDLYAAITSWAKAGARADAERLIREGRANASLFQSAHAEVNKQLDDLQIWLDSLNVVPSLRDFAQPLPVGWREAA